MEPRVVVAEPGRFPASAAEWIAEAVRAAAAALGRCRLALAGGSTPEPVYRLLAESPFSRRVPWDRLEIFFGDERAVPPAHPESNYGMVRDALLACVPIPETQIHRMEAERADREAAAAEYAALLEEPLDLLVLGMGPDGHTASLFPEAAALGERERRVVVVSGSKPPNPRLTITPPVIAAARDVLVLVAGAEKAATVARALEGPFAPRAIPAQLARRGCWFLDRAAAGRLTGAPV